MISLSGSNTAPEPMPIGHGSSAIAVVRFECGMAQLEALGVVALRLLRLSARRTKICNGIIIPKNQKQTMWTIL